MHLLRRSFSVSINEKIVGELYCFSVFHIGGEYHSVNSRRVDVSGVAA
jgi:hypothetical protein